MKKLKAARLGGTLDDFLKEEGIYEETQAQAIKEVVAWQLAAAMKARKLSRARMAILLKTSRTQINRLLDPTQDMSEDWDMTVLVLVVLDPKAAEAPPAPTPPKRAANVVSQ